MKKIILFTFLIILSGCQIKNDNSKEKFICPKKEYIDCMSSVEKENLSYCSKEYRNWIEENCKNIYFTD